MGADFGKSRGEGGHTANPFRGGGYGYFLGRHINFFKEIVKIRRKEPNAITMSECKKVLPFLLSQLHF